jgi:Arc/MetJ family transcription regulator
VNTTTRTTVELDDDLLNEACGLTGVDTKKGVIELALRELVQKRKQKDIRDLIGVIQFEDDYRTTYKQMRED